MTNFNGLMNSRRNLLKCKAALSNLPPQYFAHNQVYQQLNAHIIMTLAWRMVRYALQKDVKQQYVYMAVTEAWLPCASQVLMHLIRLHVLFRFPTDVLLYTSFALMMAIMTHRICARLKWARFHGNTDSNSFINVDMADDFCETSSKFVHFCVFLSARVSSSWCDQTHYWWNLKPWWYQPQVTCGGKQVIWNFVFDNLS